MSHSKSQTARRQSVYKSYILYAVSFHGSYLDSIHEEFVEQVKTGLRRKVFIVNFDELKNQTQIRAESVATKKSHRAEKPKDIMQLLLKAIGDCKREYDRITAEIEKEKQFDLYTYWLNNMGQLAIAQEPVVSTSKTTKTQREPKAQAKGKTGRTQRASIQRMQSVEQGLDLSTCPLVERKTHNIVGQPEKISKRKYIEDEPENSKILIIIIGNMGGNIYEELLSRGEPLVGVVHFIPCKMPYDIMIPNKIKEQFTLETYQNVHILYDHLRDPNVVKHTGLFKQELPEISRCLAQKMRKDIYNELTWFFYDLEMLRKYYKDYYVTPYNALNVEMPKKIVMQEVFEFLESMDTGGRYLKPPIKTTGTDDVTVSMYVNNLFSTFDTPEDLLTEDDILIYTTKLSMTFSDYQKQVECAYLEKKAFHSITREKKFNRIFVEDTNTLLKLIISNANQKIFRSIYNACLEYYVLCNYIPLLLLPSATKTNCKAIKDFNLPIFLKYLPTDEVVMQRLVDLFTEYNDYQVYDLNKKYKLYYFCTIYNELFEEEKEIVLPSCLCFRDFTLFQLKEFKRDLVTPQERQAAIEANKSVEEIMQAKEAEYKIPEDLYVRPKSLRALYGNIKFGCKEEGKELLSEKKVQIIDANTESDDTAEKMDYVGLPPNHPLLFGYNLDDVRQEMITKTSKYFFEEGSIRFYEEKFVRKHTNWKIEMCMHENKMNFNCVTPQQPTVEPKFRITTKNDITICLLPHATETAKSIINYPNGLSIFYHEDYAEQYWHREKSFKNECKRVYTPFAAVIVFYKTDDLVLIMRYNGEVYRLYQYEEPPAEEEEEAEAYWSNEEKSSTTNFRTQQTAKSDHTFKSKQTDISATDATTKLSKAQKSESVNTSKANTYMNMSSTELLSTSTSYFKTKIDITDIIMNELVFLNQMKLTYNLRYIWLKITTSVGRIVKISSSNKIIDCGFLRNVEWHDYVADESYCMRQDGVKMLWTKDKYKCFHKDGTRFVARTEEYEEIFEFYDELDIYITTSSSHINEESQVTTEKAFSTDAKMSVEALKNTISIQRKSAKKLKRKSKRLSKQLKKQIETELPEDYYEGGMEEEAIEPNIYICYTCNDILIQHKSYAAVRFALLNNIYHKVHLDVFAIDGIHINQDIISSTFLDTKITTDNNNEQTDASEVNKVSNADDKLLSEDKTEDMPTFVPVIKVSIDNRFRIAATPQECHMLAYLTKYKEDEGEVIDTFNFVFDFKTELRTIFQNFIKQMSEYKNYKIPKCKEHFFVQRINKRDTMKNEYKGFDFYEELPELAELHSARSNTLTELIPLQTADEKMQNEYAHYKRDMLKFPRFSKRKKQNISDEDFPKIFTVNAFCKVPRLLRNSRELHKFLDPFDKIDFKHMRRHFKETLIYFMKPHLITEQKKLMSAINWRLRNEEQYKRLHEEQQRISLYNAILKYKQYPRYFPFMIQMCGHVKNIDFMEYFRKMYVKKAARDAEKEREEAEMNGQEKNATAKYRKARRECLRREANSSQ